MLDDENTITPLQSRCVQAALGVFLLSVFKFGATVLGITLDIEFIKHSIDMGMTAVGDGATAWLAYVAIKNRINATKTIVTKKE